LFSICSFYDKYSYFHNQTLLASGKNI
jgi:hypothetical protein